MWGGGGQVPRKSRVGNNKMNKNRFFVEEKTYVCFYRRGCAFSGVRASSGTKLASRACWDRWRRRFARDPARLGCYLFGSLPAGLGAAPRWRWCGRASLCSCDSHRLRIHLPVGGESQNVMNIHGAISNSYRRSMWFRRRRSPCSAICIKLYHRAVQTVHLLIVAGRTGRKQSKPDERRALSRASPSPRLRCRDSISNISHRNSWKATSRASQSLMKNLLCCRTKGEMEPWNRGIAQKSLRAIKA